MDLTLYAQTYRASTPGRQQELNECLRRNLNHPAISKVVLFKESDASPLPQASVELEVVDALLLPWRVDLVLRQELPDELEAHVRRVGLCSWRDSSVPGGSEP
jgi:hypothetical protein